MATDPATIAQIIVDAYGRPVGDAATTGTTATPTTATAAATKPFADIMRALVTLKPRGSYGRGEERRTYQPGARELLDFTKKTGWAGGASLADIEKKFSDLITAKGIAYSPDLKAAFASRYRGALLGHALQSGQAPTADTVKTQFGGFDIATQPDWLAWLTQTMPKVQSARQKQSAGRATTSQRTAAAQTNPGAATPGSTAQGVGNSGTTSVTSTDGNTVTATANLLKQLRG